MINLLRKRRSIRNYKPLPIEEEKLSILKEALLRSPSSRGINPWEFVLIDDKQTLIELSRSKQHGSEFLKNASLGIVILGNEKRSDVWIEDCSIASIIVQLAAEDLGLGSCWVQIRERNHNDEISSEQYVQQLLRIPSHMRVLSIIGIGYPNEKKEPVANEKLQFRKIHHNKYGI
jgi:nitroreductase